MDYIYLALGWLFMSIYGLMILTFIVLIAYISIRELRKAGWAGVSSYLTSASFGFRVGGYVAILCGILIANHIWELDTSDPTPFRSSLAGAASIVLGFIAAQTFVTLANKADREREALASKQTA
jgi:hypothetical protein